MNPTDARKILGLVPDEDAMPHLGGISSAREHIAAMVRSAPNPTLADRYRKGLLEFDEALVVVHADLVSAGKTPPPLPFTTPGEVDGDAQKPSPIEQATLTEVIPTPPAVDEKPVEPPVIQLPKPEPLKTIAESKMAEAPAPESPSPAKETTPPAQEIPPPAKTVVLASVGPAKRPGSSPAQTAPPQESPAPADISEEEPGQEEEVRKGRLVSYFAWFLIFLTAAMGGAWFYLQNEQHKQEQALLEIANLEKRGAVFVENRRWQEAADAFSEIEKIMPDSEVALRGRRSIEAGMAEEQTQFIGYWTGQATAELEAGRLEEAVKAARQVLDRYPNEEESKAIIAQIETARSAQSRLAALANARKAMEEQKWDEAASLAKAILANAPDDADAKLIITESAAAKEKLAADRRKAAELLKLAIARDNGQFDAQALELLREAKSLDPSNVEISSRLEKLSSYSRTLRVPGDFATPAEALANARDRDRIIIGAATWKGPLVINAAVELQGAGFADTVVECPPEEGSAITIGPDAKGARITGISFRHEAFAPGTDRYSVALVRGGTAAFADCRFTDGSGHGLAIIAGGQATVSRSRFADNGWDGAAAIGSGSRMELRECESLNNFEHGIESWDGAAVILSNNRCEGNSRNGIHSDNGLASATIEGNQLLNNREFGLVLGSAGGGKISGNTARGNLLGGIVIRNAAAKLPVSANKSTGNSGPGLVLERGLPAGAYAANTVSKNTGAQILTDTDLTVEEPIADKEQPEGEAPNSPPQASQSSSDVNIPFGTMEKIDPTAADPDAPAPPRATIVIEPPSE